MSICAQRIIHNFEFAKTIVCLYAIFMQGKHKHSKNA